jgi:hypothetical protein
MYRVYRCGTTTRPLGVKGVKKISRFESIRRIVQSIQSARTETLWKEAVVTSLEKQTDTEERHINLSQGIGPQAHTLTRDHPSTKF